jgi:hypothetical protein
MCLEASAFPKSERGLRTLTIWAVYRIRGTITVCNQLDTLEKKPSCARVCGCAGGSFVGWIRRIGILHSYRHSDRLICALGILELTCGSGLAFGGRRKAGRGHECDFDEGLVCFSRGDGSMEGGEANWQLFSRVCFALSIREPILKGHDSGEPLSCMLVVRGPTAPIPIDPLFWVKHCMCMACRPIKTGIVSFCSNTAFM